MAAILRIPKHLGVVAVIALVWAVIALPTPSVAAPISPGGNTKTHHVIKKRRSRHPRKHKRRAHQKQRGHTASAQTHKPASQPTTGSPSATPSGAPQTPAILAPTGPVLFDGAQETAWTNQSAAANRVQTVPDPAGSADSALHFTTYNSDTAPLTPTGNPRSQLITPTNILAPGKEFWESFQVYLPDSFPLDTPADDWIALGSPFYGSPFNGSPSIELQIVDGKFYWNTDAYAPTPGKVLWSSPVVRGTWIRFTWHVIASTAGFVELYVNGAPVSVTYDGVTGNGVHIPVVDSTNNRGPWFSQLSVYYKYGAFAGLDAYFKDFKIGTTQVAAES
jgi:hypothetical protein